MIEITSYSIWLMPSRNTHAELSNLIARLSQRYAAPVFPPHVTLLGNLNGNKKELVAQAETLAARIRPFPVNLTTAGYLNEYFRCVFLQAEATPALLEANRLARNLFLHRQDSEFMPHLSLLYGIFNARTKQQIITSIGPELPRSFMVHTVYLFSTAGDPKDWRQVAQFALPNRQENSDD